MTLTQFNLLDELEQAETIWEYGEFLQTRLEGEYRHILYQVDGFYVELHYHLLLNTITGARVFANPDHLEPYLEAMSISL